MSDLISRQALIEELCSSCDRSACDGLGRDSTAKCFSVRLVEEQPAAYDVDKVVEKLDEQVKAFTIIANFCEIEGDKEKEAEVWRQVREYRHVIKIVKAGGVNE